MTGETDGPRASAGRPPPWRDVRVLRWVFQVAVVVLAFGLYWFIAGNLLSNLRRQGISTSFDFLEQPAGFGISDSDFDSADSVLAALRVGIKNTLTVAAVGIALATVVGVLVGIARTSRNWLMARAAGIYVETLRNVPLLVIIIFFYTAVILRLPALSDSDPVAGGLLVVSSSGVVVPSLEAVRDGDVFAMAVAAAVVLAALVWIWRTRRFDATGEPHRRVVWSGATLVVVVAVAYAVLRGPVRLSLPTRDGLLVEGGLRLGPEYAALLVGLVVYTASHIAEIVRGSIQAVPRGQSEAATALGLREAHRLRFVVLPQAFRIAVPPIANQYLNLTKNSSLAVFVAFPEVTRVTRIVIGQGNPAPQSIALMMVIYLTFSLAISAGTNLVNRRLRVVGR